MQENNQSSQDRDALLAEAAAQRADLAALLPQLAAPLKTMRRSLSLAQTVIRSPILVTAGLFTTGWLINRLLSVSKRVAGPLALLGFLPKLIELLLRPKAVRAATQSSATQPAASP